MFEIGRNRMIDVCEVNVACGGWRVIDRVLTCLKRPSVVLSDQIETRFVSIAGGRSSSLHTGPASRTGRAARTTMMDHRLISCLFYRWVDSLESRQCLHLPTQLDDGPCLFTSIFTTFASFSVRRPVQLH